LPRFCIAFVGSSTFIQMNAKEKAVEIYNQFKNVRIYISQEPSDIDSTMQYIDNDAVRECSIIAIDFIIQSIKKAGEYSSKAQIEWWERVKSELPS
jgi:hypothetical protein